MPFEVTPIGWVRGGRDHPFDDHWGKSLSAVELDSEQFEGTAFQGLEAFSHVEIVYLFDRVADVEIVWGARRPRGRSDWPDVGIFAQRGKNRPNRLGVTVCRVCSIKGIRLEVEGLDAVDGTPVLDVKPYLTGFAPRGAVHEPEWARQIMAEYW